VIPYNPLAAHADRQAQRHAPPPEGSRFQLGTAGARYQERYWHAREFETIDALRTIPPGRHDHGDDGDALVISNRDHRADRRSQPSPSSSPTASPRRAGTVAKDLKARSTKITREWRAIDAER